MLLRLENPQTQIWGYAGALTLTALAGGYCGVGDFHTSARAKQGYGMRPYGGKDADDRLPTVIYSSVVLVSRSHFALYY